MNKVFFLFFAIVVPAFGQIYDTNTVWVQTFAGSGFSGYVDGTNTQTMFDNPTKVVPDTFGNLFVLDLVNDRIRKLTPSGTVSTFAGGGAQSTGFGTNVSLSFSQWGSMAIDHTNNIWVIAYNSGPYYLIKIGPDGFVTRFATNVSGSGFTTSSGLCTDSLNRLYYTAANRIYRYLTNGTIEVFVGSGNTGATDGNGIFTSFSSPTELTCDNADNIYVWDSGNTRIRRVNQNRDVETIAGLHTGNFDGNGTNTGFSTISAMWCDSIGTVYLACGTCIRRMDAATNVVTVAGSFTQSGYTNDVAGSLARFNGASGICLSQGMLFVADKSNQRIRNITFNPTTQPVTGANLDVSTYAGVKITGTLGRSYRVESSFDMNAWNTETTLLLTSSPYLWIDPNATGQKKFYRAFLLP